MTSGDEGLDLLDGRVVFLPSCRQVKADLKVHPELRRGSEQPLQAQRRIFRHPALAGYETLNPRSRHAKSLRRPDRRQAVRADELLHQNFARMHRGKSGGHGLSSVSEGLVVVDELNVGWTGQGPDEADPKRVVDADRMLPCAVALSSLQTVRRRRTKAVQRTAASSITSLRWVTLSKSFGHRRPGHWPAAMAAKSAVLKLWIATDGLSLSTRRMYRETIRNARRVVSHDDTSNALTPEPTDTPTTPP